MVGALVCTTSAWALVACAASPPSAVSAHSTGSPAPSSTSSSASIGALPSGASLVAVARASVVWATSPDGSMRWGLSHPNADGAPLVLLVLARRPGGLLVRIPARPNGATGWIATADVATAVDPYALRVSLRQHQLTVSRLGVAVRTFRLGVGRPDAPTPTGRFFLTELVRPPDPRGPLGPVAFGISAFSDVYNEFAGGIGQIGLHGTNDPSSIGRNVSHGCLRVSVAAIRTLARLVPVGTPITIDR